LGGWISLTADDSVLHIMPRFLSIALCSLGLALWVSACSSSTKGNSAGGDAGPSGSHASGGASNSADSGAQVSNGGRGNGGRSNGNGGTSNSTDGSVVGGPDASNNTAADSGADATVAPGGPVAAIPLATNLDTSAAADDDAALQQLVGEYDVAIFFAPVGKESDIGAGKIKIAYDGDIITLTLKNASGITLAEVANSRMNPMNYGQAAYTRIIGKILVDQRDTEYMRIDVDLLPTGSVSGYVGGSGEYYHFRNNVIHYGPTPPQHLIAQVGTWSGPQLALTCGQPPVTVAITAAGGVTISGKGNLDCMDAQVQNQWDGQDDYVEPKPNSQGLVNVVIDSARGGGSQAEGGMKIIVDEDPTVVGVKGARAGLSGTRGNLEVDNPVKQ
jgi:hypothetical protein